MPAEVGLSCTTSSQSVQKVRIADDKLTALVAFGRLRHRQHDEQISLCIAAGEYRDSEACSGSECLCVKGEMRG
jgi:hypothetical protein